MPGRCHFHEKWLEKDAYKSWLRKDNKNSNKAFGFACKKSIDLNVMGESALVSHMKGKKHEEYINNLQGNEKTTQISDFFSSSASTSIAQQTANSRQRHCKQSLWQALQSKRRKVSSLFLAQMQHFRQRSAGHSR